jgi:hypothetical protein
MKVKFFYDSVNPDAVERKFQKWLDENPGIKIESMSQGTWGATNNPIIVVVYKEKGKGGISVIK